MRVSSLVLGVGATVVAAGGLYLFLSLDDAGSQPTPEQLVAAAEQGSGERAAGAGERPDRDPARSKARPPRPQARDTHATYDPDIAARGAVPAPQADFRKGTGAPAIDLPAKFRGGDLVDPPQEYGQVPAEHAEELLEANKLYDRGDFDGARSLAKKMLDRTPGNVRMLRVVVSSACIMGDADEAQRFAAQLPPQDHAAMTARCAKYDIALTPKS